MDIADLLNAKRHNCLLGLKLKIVKDSHRVGERQTQYRLNNTDFVMLNDKEKAY